MPDPTPQPPTEKMLCWWLAWANRDNQELLASPLQIAAAIRILIAEVRRQKAMLQEAERVDALRAAELARLRERIDGLRAILQGGGSVDEALQNLSDGETSK